MELVRIPQKLESAENDAVVSCNANKLQAGGSLATDSENMADGSLLDGHLAGSSLTVNTVSGHVLAPVESQSLALTPLKQLMLSASSPSSDSKLTPTRLPGFSRKPSTQARAQITPSKSPRSMGKSPVSGRASTPSKSPVSSSRQRSLTEMFSRSGAVAYTSNVLSETLSASKLELPEAGVKMGDMLPVLDSQISSEVQVLVEDSQMGRSSPVRAVDTQESLFVDETPPKSPSITAATDAGGDGLRERGKDATGMQVKLGCDILGDSCDANSSSYMAVTQPTVIHIDSDKDDVSAVTAIAIQPLVSDANIVAPHPISKESNAQDSNARDVFGTDFNLPLTTASDTQMTPIADDHTQEAVIDLTQMDTVDHTQPTAVDCTPRSGLDSDHGQQEELEDTQQSLINDENVKPAAAEDDVLMKKITRSEDDPLSNTDNDVALYLLNYQKGNERNDDSKVPELREETPDARVRSRRRKDAVHATICGRVSRTVITTRPTRLNLRTRSVRRVTDQLVSAGAKKVDKLSSKPPEKKSLGRRRKLKPDDADADASEVRNGRRLTRLSSQVPGSQPKGRSRKSKSDSADVSRFGNVQNLSDRGLRMPYVYKRSSKSSWVRVVAAEGNDAAAGVEKDQDRDSPVEVRIQRGVEDADKSQISVEKSIDADRSIDSSVEKCDDGIITELAPDRDGSKAEGVTLEDRGEVRSVDIVVIDKSEEQEVVQLDADVEPVASGEDLAAKSSGTNVGQETTVIEDSMSEVLESESSGKPEFGKSMGQETESNVTEILATRSSSKAESGTSLGQAMVVIEDSEVEMTSEECSKESSAPVKMIITDIAVGNSRNDVVDLVYISASSGNEKRGEFEPLIEVNAEKVCPDGGLNSEMITPVTVADAQNAPPVVDSISGPAPIPSSSGEDFMTNINEISGKWESEPTTNDTGVPKELPSDADKTVPTSDDNGESQQKVPTCVSETVTDADKTTPTSDGNGESHWKVPALSITRGQSTSPGDAPPETPTSIPQRRFTSRGSLMLERAKQLRNSTTSPHVKSTTAEHGSEEETKDRSPYSMGRNSSSGLSKLRVFSPAASPSASILRKRQLSTDSAGSGQSPTSPSSKVSRLHSCLCLWTCVLGSIVDRLRRLQFMIECREKLRVNLLRAEI